MKKLSAYNKKRKFDETPEPEGAKDNPQNAKPLSFVIHEHHARRLHYDLRLELDGVLKSWAVPKGPPQNPGDKRLAVHVEDHPLSYGSFSGIIPAGNYGAGTVHIWDHGAYSSMQTASRAESEKILRNEYRKGRMHILMAGEKLKGLYTLIRTKDNQWLWMVKEKGARSEEIGARRTEKDPMPQNTKPMLAQSAELPFDKEGWVFEIKWDGYRAISELAGHRGRTGIQSKQGQGQVQIFSRSGQNFTEKFKPIADALRTQVPYTCMLDGEIIALDERGRPQFQLLQEYEMNPVRIAYAIFDLLYIDGEDLRDTPLIERKKILQAIIPENSPDLLFSAHVETKGTDFFYKVRELEGEGIIAKRADSVYESRRSDAWLKIKAEKRQEAIIVGFTKPRKSRGYFGALVLGLYEDGELKYIGHTGTGFSEAALRSLYEKLLRLKTSKSPFKNEPKTNMPVTWVKPKLVCEIRFTEWTNEGSLRHPVFLGLREDKRATEVIREQEKRNKEQEDRKEQAVRSKEQGARSKESFTNTDKIFWPKEKYTKGDVIEYYRKIAPIILPYLKDRPESLLRNPNGINGQSFFQKNIEQKNLPDFVDTIKIYSERGGMTNYLLCQNEETLLYLANLGCIELNPWNSKKDNLDFPDIMIIDLDPVNRPFSDAVKVAKITKEVLDTACESSFCKTSGKRGLHLIVPLIPKYDYEAVRLFSSLLVRIVHSRIPEITSLERSPKKRDRKIYLDWLQNRKGQTLAAPYSLRPYPGATVSAPVGWNELNERLDPAKFNIKTIWKRLEKKGDLWKDLHTNPVDLADSTERLKKELKRLP
jgi:bifunctional non-homologous end joining protein LigD